MSEHLAEWIIAGQLTVIAYFLMGIHSDFKALRVTVEGKAGKLELKEISDKVNVVEGRVIALESRR